MCRLLAVTAETPFRIADHLRPFAAVARNSREFQGDGWGCAWQEDGAWRTRHSLTPIWQDDLAGFGRARVLLAHARSAFRNEGIAIENNMPFVERPFAFAFNGELRGVRIAESGRIGAEKLFRFLLRRGGGEGVERLRSAVGLVEERTRYLRALNFVLAGEGRFSVCCRFGEDEDYFTLHARREPGMTVICSGRYEGDPVGWEALPNHHVEVIPWFS